MTILCTWLSLEKRRFEEGRILCRIDRMQCSITVQKLISGAVQVCASHSTRTAQTQYICGIAQSPCPVCGDDPRRAPVHTTAILRQGPLIKRCPGDQTQQTQEYVSEQENKESE